MDTHLHRETLSPLIRKVLWADAAVELIVAIVLTGAVGRVHWWLNVERPVTLTAAAVFLAAGVAVGWLAWSASTSPALVRYLAFANIAGGAALWLGAMLNWDRFESEGAWLIAAVADAFVVIGLLELFALRQQNQENR